jgi:hypothetical protein
MKKLKRKLMNKYTLTLCLSIISFSTFASPFGRVVDVKGSGFISHGGKTKDVRVGDIIELNSEIVVEHSGQITFTDNADHRFHMGNASSVAVLNDHVELRSGDIWFQSINRTEDYKITSANASVVYQGGEAILSYDSVKGKSQLMVISGMMKLGNLRAQELNLSVAEGNFSFIDNAYDEGAPRDPTPVGEKTYRQLVTLFKNVSPMEANAVHAFKENDHKAAARTIASVPAVEMDKDKELEAYKAKMLETPKKTKVEKTEKVATVPAKVITKKSVVTPLVVKIYGLKETSDEKVASAPVVAAPEVTKSRAPASVLEEPVPTTEIKPSTNTNEHYKESDKLINQLKGL